MKNHVIHSNKNLDECVFIQTRQIKSEINNLGADTKKNHLEFFSSRFF